MRRTLSVVFGVLLVLFGVISLFSLAALAWAIGTVIGVSVIVAGANLVHFGMSSWMA